MEKSQGEYIERESAGNVSPSLNSQANTKLDLEKANLPDDTVDQEREYTGLSDEHREYLLRRHGTVHLDPLPSLDDADPYNWPNWKVGLAQIVKVRSIYSAWIDCDNRNSPISSSLLSTL